MPLDYEKEMVLECSHFQSMHFQSMHFQRVGARVYEQIDFARSELQGITKYTRGVNRK